MRRIALAFALLLVSPSAVGLAPSPANAQTNSLTISVSPTTVAVGNTATVNGSGFTPNNYVFVYWQRPDGTSNGAYAFTDYTGAFSFQLGFSAVHGSGDEFVSGYDYGTARWARFFDVKVTSGTPPPTGFQLFASPNPVKVGGTSIVRGQGFSPNAYVFVQWQRPDGTTNGIYVPTDANGTFTFQLGFLTQHGCGGNEAVSAYDYGRGMYSPTYNISVTC